MRRVAFPIALAVLLGPRIAAVSAQEEEGSGEEEEVLTEEPDSGDDAKDDAGDAKDEAKDDADDASDDSSDGDGSAEAGGSASVSTADAAPGSGELRMTLPQGAILIQAFLQVNMSTDLVAKPVSLAPDIWYGVNDDLTVGVIHSGQAGSGLWGGVGQGLCLTGEENGCAKLYNSVGLDARYHIYASGGMTAAIDGGLFAKTIDPFALSLKLGLTGRWQGGALGLEFGPNVAIGLTEREGSAEGEVVVVGNQEVATIPVNVLYGISDQLGILAQVAATLPFDSLGDTYTIGVSAGVKYMVSQQLGVDLAFSLPFIAGGADGAGADFRTLTLGVSYAL